MPASQEHVLQYLRDEVWNFTHSCEGVITIAKYLSSAEREVILGYTADLHEHLRSLEQPDRNSHAGNSGQDRH
jgi:hypothetical protein